MRSKVSAETRRLLCYLIPAWGIIAALMYAQESPRDGAFTRADVTAVLRAFGDYNHALITKDYLVLRNDHLAVPFTIVGISAQIIDDVDTVVAGLRRNRESLDASGYYTSEVVKPRLSILNQNAILLNCRIRHLRQNGSLILERANFYIMNRVGGAWKIAGVMSQAPAYMGLIYEQ